MIQLICGLTLMTLLSGAVNCQEQVSPPKKPDTVADKMSGLDGFFKIEPLGETAVTYLPKNKGRYCVNWVKISDTLPATQRDRNTPKDWATYRTIICEATGGRCPEPQECAQEKIRVPFFSEEHQKQLNKVYRYEPNYVPLKSDQLKFVENWKDGRTVEFNDDVRFESQKEKYKLLPEKHAALFEKFPPPDGAVNFCTMPVKITGKNEGPDKIPETISCMAIIDEDGKLACPGVPVCVQNRFRWKAPLAQANGKPANTELALEPHAPSKSAPKGKAAPTQTHF